ncbi:S10 family peptidase [Sphingomonas nostoxanthinifaciens]|uniref:S10 family peptidase n=1 Tax=Sphingomonas nostoxanthinifaciens TaxID=2872652 RepID=UPI001CC1D761|nr:peptidase S10 [Sphingomonas nostoxanthinifaciens]UAK23448.1 peptidase S10 [Sphingomonas nostoxanthinifaciens]
MTLKPFLLAGAVAALVIAPLAAQNRSAPEGKGKAKPNAEAQHAPDEPGATDAEPRGHGDKMGDPDMAVATAVEQAQPKRGSVTVNGKLITYTVTPGTLTIRNDDGEPIASMFYVAYVADRAKGAPERPITFAYNGGPGSSSMWLHMGSMGPVRVDTPQPGAQPNGPFPIGENHNTILDHTDIVFMDAIGTGLSRPIGKSKGPEFWGVDQDIDAYTRAIMRYMTINDRWNSPKFLFGESYGTLRSAGLVYALQDKGVQMNGVVLLSSILNYGVRQPGYDQIHVTYLPSYAADAWYHNRLQNRPATLEPFLTQVRAWAAGPYASALQKGSDISPQEKQAIAQQMSAYTGLPVDYILKSDLRVDLSRFRKELLRGEGKTIGRLDARFTGYDADDAGEGPEYDPADTSLSGPYIGALNKYLFGTLGYKTKLSYRPNYYVAIGGNHWDSSHKAPGRGGFGKMALADTALDLAQAMRQNPSLKVMSLNGYYDMATPFFGAEFDLKHMQIPADLRKNLSFKYYESGHMVYVNNAVRPQFKQDIDDFIDMASRPGG